MTNNKNVKGKYHVRIYLKDVFGFAEQKKATYGLGSKLTLTKASDNAVLNKTNATPIVKIKINSIEWYVPHHTASLKEQGILMKQITDKIPTELRYVERSVFIKQVNTQNLWRFELGTREGVNVPIWIIVGFQQRERQDSRNLANDTFYRPPVTSAQCIIGTEKYPDSAILLNFNDDDYSQGYGPIKEAFRAFIKDNILTPYITEDDFRSSNVGDDGNEVGYDIHAFDMRYQKIFESGQLVKVEFKLDEVVPAFIFGYALVLTNRIASISSDGQRMFDLNSI